jgi:hypothetical protein
VIAEVGAVDTGLGETIRALGMVLHGELSQTRWTDLLNEVTARIGMHPVAAPVIFNYPVDGGKGGNGQTQFLPITESFLVLDTWPDHRGAYLFICSCRPFFAGEVEAVAREFGLTSEHGPRARFFTQLNLVRETA